MKKVIVFFATALILCSTAFSENYADGTFQGKGVGKSGEISVTVTVANQKITDVKVTNHNETINRPAIAKAFRQIPKEIVKKNGTDGVDVVSGATLISDGILAAVKDALKNTD